MTEKTETKWVPVCDRCFQTEVKTRLNSAWHTVIVAMFWIFVTSLTGYTIGHELLTKINLHDGQWIFGAILWVTLISTCAFFAFRALWELLVGRALFDFIDASGGAHVHPIHPYDEIGAWHVHYLRDTVPFVLQTRAGGIFRKSLILEGRTLAAKYWYVENLWNGFLHPRTVQAVYLKTPMVGWEDGSTPNKHLKQVLEDIRLYQKLAAFREFTPDEKARVQIRSYSPSRPTIPALFQRLQNVESYLLAMILVIYEAKARGVNSPHAATVGQGLVECGTRLFGDKDGDHFTITVTALRYRYHFKQPLAKLWKQVVDDLLAQYPLSPHACPDCRYPLIIQKTAEPESAERHSCVFCGTAHTEESLATRATEKTARVKQPAMAATDAIVAEP